MNLPGWIFGLLWVPTLGLGYYAWKGRGGWLWMLASVLFAGLGFLGGHVLARYLGWAWGQVGPWHLGPAVGGGLAMLMGTDLLLRPRSGETHQRNKRRPARSREPSPRKR